MPGLIELITPATTARRAAPCGARRPRGPDRDPGLGRQPGGPEDADERRRLDPRVTGCPTSCRRSSRPSFQGYASGHSTFSRAAAEVLTGFTGSEYFPGGLAATRSRPGSLKFEAGPHDRRPPRMGDVLRRRRPGRPIAPVRRHPHPGGRLHRPDHRLAVRQGRVGAGAALLRGHGGGRDASAPVRSSPADCGRRSSQSPGWRSGSSERGLAVLPARTVGARRPRSARRGSSTRPPRPG